MPLIVVLLMCAISYYLSCFRVFVLRQFRFLRIFALVA